MPARVPLLRRRWLWLLAVIVVGLAALALARWLLRPDPEPTHTVTVARGNLEKTVTAVGSLQPKLYVDVGTQVSGQLEKVYAQIGDRVQKGQLIARIDPVRYEATVSNERATLEGLRAELVQRKAELELAQLQLARNRRMLEVHAVSQDVVDQAQATAKVNEAAVVALQAQIRAAEATLEGSLANLDFTKIYAPIDGTVVSQTTLEGQTVNANQSTPVIVQVANLDVMTVWAQVAEADVNKVRPGMPVYFTTLGMAQKRWHGMVRQVLPTPETTNNVVLYKVLIDVENSEQLLLPSMTVQVFFVLGEVRDVPLVALSALKPMPRGGGDMYRAMVLTREGPQPRQVQIGLATRTEAQVVSGLAEGDQVIVEAAPAVNGNGAGSNGQRRPQHRPMMPRL